MRALAILSALALTGCGVSAENFQTKYAEAYCEWALECLDDAVLEFNGWTDLDTCVPDFGGRFVSATDGCIYDPKAAKQCLKAMKKHPCSSAPDVPEACETAFICNSEDSGV